MTRVSVIPKSELWKRKIMRQWLIFIENLFTRDFFQVTYYDVYSWEEKHLKRQVYKEVILQ